MHDSGLLPGGVSWLQGRVQRLVLLGVPCLPAEVPFSWSGLRGAALGGCWNSMAQLLGCYMPVRGVRKMDCHAGRLVNHCFAAMSRPWICGQLQVVVSGTSK